MLCINLILQKACCDDNVHNIHMPRVQQNILVTASIIFVYSFTFKDWTNEVVHKYTCENVSRVDVMSH